MPPRRGAPTLPQPDAPEDGPPTLPPRAARVQDAAEEARDRARPDRDAPTQKRNALPAAEGAARLAPASSRPLTLAFTGRSEQPACSVAHGETRLERACS